MVKSVKILIIAAASALAAGPAAAQGGGMVLWDQHFAVSMNELLISDDDCRQGPYRLYRQTCVGNELNITLEREDRHQTLLDRVALFVHRYKDLNLNQELRPGTGIKLKAKLSNLYKQEAEVRVTLRIQF